MIVESIFSSNYFQTFCTVAASCLLWVAYNQKLRKIPLEKMDEVTKLCLSSCDIGIRESLTRSEILEVNRVLPRQVERRMDGKVSILGGIEKQKPAPFNPAAYMLDQNEKPVRFMRDIMDTRYLTFPPRYVTSGTLPPIDFELNDELLEIYYADFNAKRMTLIERIFHPLEFEIRLAYLQHVSKRLEDKVLSRQEILAAFYRVASCWSQVETPPFLAAIKNSIDNRYQAGVRPSFFY